MGPGFPYTRRRIFSADGRCGTRLFAATAKLPGFVSLVVATLDEEPDRGPTAHLNVESKSRWFEIRDELPAFDALPDSVTRMLEAAEGD